MSKPTHQDALVYIQLLRYQHETGFSDAQSYMLSDEFPRDYEEYKKSRSEGKLNLELMYAYLYMIDLIGALFRHGLIHEDFLFPLQTFEGEWEKFKDIVYGYREENDNPKFMLGLEEMAKAEKQK